MNTKIRALSGQPLITVLGACALCASSLALAQSNSPWLPIPGSGSVNASYVYQNGDSAYIGDNKLPLSAITGGGAQRYKRDSVGVKFTYGILDAVSVDAAVSYAKTRVGSADNSSGIADSVVGLNWRVLDEFEKRSLPTVTLRAVGILKGNYDGGRLAALGKDANGYGLSLLVGRQITPSFSVWGGVGFEQRSDDVPNAKFIDINAAYVVVPKLSVSAGYSNKKFGGNLDIGGPGFTPARFQQVREERETARLGAAFAVTNKQSIGVNLGKTIGGRNTVKDDLIFGVNYSFGF
jgi:hypothetical protein